MKEKSYHYKIAGFHQFYLYFWLCYKPISVLFPSTEPAQVAAAPVVIRHMITTCNVQHSSPHALAVSEGQKAQLLPVNFGASGDADGSKSQSRVSEIKRSIFFDNIELLSVSLW